MLVGFLAVLAQFGRKQGSLAVLMDAATTKPPVDYGGNSFKYSLGGLAPVNWGATCADVDVPAAKMLMENRIADPDAVRRRHTTEGNNIMFMLTSDGGHTSAPGFVPLPPKTIPELYQCAIEAAALTNPHMNITLYVRGNAPWRPVGAPESLRWLLSLPNVHVVSLGLPDGERVRKGVYSLPRLWKSNRWRNDQNLVAHLTDMLRMQFLWQRGGVWSDLDGIFTKPVPEEWMGKAFAVKNGNGEQFSSGVIGDGKGGAMTTRFLKQVADWYDPGCWE
jgi:hypothetical protein